jgi:hypothetical protein
VLPDPPDSLPEAPRAFYEALRAGGAPDAIEVDFGDSGVGVTFAGALGAQVSLRAAVVFAGNDVAHFDERSDGWERAAADWLLARVDRA